MVARRPAKLAFLFCFDGMILTEAVVWAGNRQVQAKSVAKRNCLASLAAGYNPAHERSRAQKATIPVSASEREREAVKRR